VKHSRYSTRGCLGTCLLLVWFALPGICGAQYNINLAAGGGPNGLPALSSSIGNPVSIARDTLGNTYLADAASNRVFKINSSGTVSVFAGNGFGANGNGGHSGDGGPATSASLNSPEGVAVDASGNVYIADTSNARIRCVVVVASGCLGSSLPVGSITTVAGTGVSCQPTGSTCGDGGAANSAHLSGPAGVFVDSLGNLFIADTFDSKIRCVVVTAGGCFSSALPVGSITTVAGTGTSGYSGDGAAATSAELNLPAGLYVDGIGNLYIADTDNSVIREVFATSSNIQTVAGVHYAFQEVCNFSGDNGPATSAQLCLPEGVALDSLGNLYIADTQNSVVREVTAGTIQTIAGTGGSSGYSGNGGAATSALLNLPSGLFLDGSNNLFIADTGNYQVREISGGSIQAYAGNHTLAYSGDGGAATNASLNALGGTAVDGLGNVYIADTYNNVVRKIVRATGNIVTVAGNGTSCATTPATCGDGGAATSAQLNVPQGVFVDSLGDIYIADTGDFAVRCVVATPGGCLGSALGVGSITTVAGTGTQCVPTGGTCGDGAAATSAELGEVFGVYVDNTGANNTPGNLFIADTGNAKIRCVVGVASGCFGSTLAVGSITTVAGTGSECQPAGSTCGDGGAATSAQLKSPASISGDSLGDLFIADTLDSKVRCIAAVTGGCLGSTAAVGNITTVAGGATPGYSGDGAAANSALLNEPYGIFVDALGNLFIADSANSALREVVAVTGNIQTLAGNGTAGYAGDPGPASSALLAEPLGVAGDSSGDLFVADTDNSRVRELISTVGVSAVPASATLPTSGPQQFAATVTGANNTFVTWEVNGIIGGNATVGTISALGSYLAPQSVPTSPTVNVTAVANANGFNLATATVTIVDGTTTSTVTISTNPAATTVYTGTTQAFAASVTDPTSTAVNWEVNGVAGGNATVGTIGSDGTYTAPASVPTPATVIITAVSQANASVSGTYPIVVVAAPTAPAPAAQTISGGSATYSMVLDGKAGYSHQAMTLSCLQSSLPQGATCTFQPAKIVAGTSGVNFALTVNLPACTASLIRPGEDREQAAQTAPPLFAVFLPLSALFLVGWRKEKKLRRLFLVVLLICAPMVGLLGCGGGGGSSGGSCPNLAGTYHIVVQGTIPGQPAPITITTVTLTVQ